MRNEFVPKLFTLLKRGISRQQWTADIFSGIGVGIVALPLAIASGVSPEKGLITAVVAGLLISFLGGSRVQIGGPTGAFIVIVYGIVSEHGVDGLTIATCMAGVLIIVMGLARFGNWLRYIPYPLIVGFTSGIALIIFSAQIRDFLGLEMDAVPPDFIGKWRAYAAHAGSINWYAVALAGGTVIVTFYFHRITRRVPGSVVALLLCTVIASVFHLPVDTIASRFGSIPNHLPAPHLPRVDFDTLKALIQPAFAIALLGAIESLLSAVVAEGMIGGRHRSNMELVAQGTANIFSALFGGIPATGALARTATNVRNGGRTPIAGIVHAIILLLIMLLLAPYAGLIPMASLAGILVVVAYNMSEWRQFRAILSANRGDITVLLTTFFLTVLFDLVIAIEIGMVLAAFLFMKRMSETVSVQSISESQGDDENLFDTEIRNLPKGILLYEINGPLFFGASQGFQDALANLHVRPKVIILRMRNVPFIDATGMQRLQRVIRDFKARHVHVLLSGVQPPVYEALQQSGVIESLGADRIYTDIRSAVHMASGLAGDQTHGASH